MATKTKSRKRRPTRAQTAAAPEMPDDFALADDDDTDDDDKPEEMPSSSFEPAAFDSFLDRVSSKASDGGRPKSIRRRTATVTIDHRLCEPGMFDEPFNLTVVGLNSADELKAMSSATDGQASAFVMAKSSIREFNGRRLKSEDVRVLWEALGTAGRIAVVNAFMNHCTGADSVILGNSLKAVEIG